MFITSKISEMNQDDLLAFVSMQRRAYNHWQSRGLKLDMSRGKPGPELLDLSNGLMAAVDDFRDEQDGDVRNYGNLPGITEARRLFGQVFDVPAEQVFVGGSASLHLMFDMIGQCFIRGAGPGAEPWMRQGEIKFLCPVPGYDRHFALCQYYGIQLVPVPMTEAGPDMDVVEALVRDDPSVKGIWCVPMYSNPDGITYSDGVVRRLAAMPTAAADFRIFWDNAYCLHHLDPAHPDRLLNIYDACVSYGTEDRPYLFASTSKVTFAGSGISAMAMSPANYQWMLKQTNMHVISYDKVNQLRHLRYLPTMDEVQELMDRHAQLLRPKFAVVEDTLRRELAAVDNVRWTKPRGGYFVSFYAPTGCAKRIVSLCREAGLTLTAAGAAYPYGNDPQDSHIRIAPSYPGLGELSAAMELFCVAVKLAAAERVFADR